MIKNLFFILALLLTTPSFAETANTDETSETTPVIDISGLENPRETFATFLRGMNDIKRGKPEQINKATRTLDLSDVNTLIRKERGQYLAWMLLEVLDKTVIIDLNNIPTQTKQARYVFHQYQKGQIALTRFEDGRWLFSAETLADLPNIVEELSSKQSLKNEIATSSAYIPWHIQFRQQLPEALKKRTFLLENWKWLAILIIIAIGVVADKLASFILSIIVKRTRSTTKTDVYKEAPDDLLRPLAMLVMAGIWWAGLNVIALPDQAMVILLVAVKILVGIAGVWSAFRLVDLLTLYLQHKAEKTDNKVDDVLVPLIRKTLKVFVTVIGITFVASNLNLNVSSLLASLGLGGLAFALAAKDVVQNLFGSITVILDQTFHTGDWVIVNDIEGSVEEVGLRSTKIRTFYDSLITLPNSIFITAKVDNMGKRRFRRLKCNVSLTYDTPPDKIEAFCEGVRELIRLHPYMRKDYYHVYLNNLAASSLDVLVYVFWETPDWGTELRERQRFLLDILRLAKSQGINMAFPTQTLHLLQSDNESIAPSPELSAEELLNQSRKTANDIVENTTGKDVKPPPVQY